MFQTERKNNRPIVATSPVLKQILGVTEDYYQKNPEFTTLRTPKRSDLGFGSTNNEKKVLTKSEIILEEMAAVVPLTNFCLMDYTQNPDHADTFVKVGLVYVTDPHTYLAAPAQKVIDEYRRAFYDYLPHARNALGQVYEKFPHGVPKGTTVEFLPLHATVWCFAEVNGKIQPLDALTLITGEGYLRNIFVTSDLQKKASLDEARKKFRFDILYAMNEYSHVAAVAIFHLYEDYLLHFFIQSILAHKEEYGLSAYWTEAQIRRNFSLFAKGIRRHINIGYDPSKLELGEWWTLLEGSREDVDMARVVASQFSGHIFLREIPYKKFWRLFHHYMETSIVDSLISKTEFEKLDSLVHTVLNESPAWKPSSDTIFDFIPNSKFIAEDTERFIKALDPYANWEGPALLELILDPLIKMLTPLGLNKVETIAEMAEAVQHYNRNISAVVMRFSLSSNEAEVRKQPANILCAVGDVLAEVYQAKKCIVQPDSDHPYSYILLEPDKVVDWQNKLRAYSPTRKMTDPDTNCSYILKGETKELLQTLETTWDKTDILRLFKQFVAQITLYCWEDIQAGNGLGITEQVSSDLVLHRILSNPPMIEDARIAKKWEIINSALLGSPTLQSAASMAITSVQRFASDNSQLSEVKLAQFLVLRTLENERLGIRVKNQRPLNTTRLPGFLLWYDYLIDHDGKYLQVSLSPIVSEASSVEKGKGMSLDRDADKLE